MLNAPQVQQETIKAQAASVAQEMKARITADVGSLVAAGVQPRMADVIASDDPGAASYAKSKVKLAAGLGIQLELVDLGSTCSQLLLETTLAGLSRDPMVHGIILELPLASGLLPNRALDLIEPKKDVDGLTALNLGLLAAGRETEAIVAATPQACIELAQLFGSVAGRRVGIVGRGRTVGRPLLGLLLNRHATPTVCHTRTLDIAAALAPCEIVIVAAGKPGLITGEHVQPGQIVIDAGINLVGNRIVGDVDAASVEAKGVRALTPVPGGVGPLTSVIIFANLVRAIRLQLAASVDL